MFPKCRNRFHPHNDKQLNQEKPLKLFRIMLKSYRMDKINSKSFIKIKGKFFEKWFTS